MNRLHDLEKERLRLTAQVCDLMSTVPDGRAASANAIAALYMALLDVLTQERNLTRELPLGVALIERINGEREMVLAKAEYWKGSALAWRDEEAHALEVVG